MLARRLIVKLSNTYEKSKAQFKLNMETHKNDALEVPDVVSEFKKTGVAPADVWLQHAESAKEVGFLYLGKTRCLVLILQLITVFYLT